MRLAVSEWADSLIGFTDEDLDKGVESWSGDWPPNLIEFRKACLGIDDASENEEWLKLGRSLGMDAHPGESWQTYIRRLQKTIHNPRLLSEARQLGDESVQRLTHTTEKG